MKNEGLEILEKDMKLNLNDLETEKFLKDLEYFKEKINEIKNINIDLENTEIMVSPIYDNEITYLREDVISDQVENSKEAVSLSAEYKDGFFTIPKVVN